MNEDLNCNNKRLYVDYNGLITEKSYTTICKYIEICIRKHNFNEIYFCLSSVGGSVNAGLEIYNYLKGLENIKIIMHNYGFIASMANVIFLAGEERYANSNATFLLHGITNELRGQFFTHQLEEFLSNMKSNEERLQKIYIDRTKLTKDEINKLFQSGEAKNADYAKEKQIITDIRDITINLNAPKILFLQKEIQLPNGNITLDIEATAFNI